IGGERRLARHGRDLERAVVELALLVGERFAEEVAPAAAREEPLERARAALGRARRAIRRAIDEVGPRARSEERAREGGEDDEIARTSAEAQLRDRHGALAGRKDLAALPEAGSASPSFENRTEAAWRAGCSVSRRRAL